MYISTGVGVCLARQLTRTPRAALAGACRAGPSPAGELAPHSRWNPEPHGPSWAPALWHIAIVGQGPVWYSSAGCPFGAPGAGSALMFTTAFAPAASCAQAPSRAQTGWFLNMYTPAAPRLPSLTSMSRRNVPAKRKPSRALPDLGGSAISAPARQSRPAPPHQRRAACDGKNEQVSSKLLIRVIIGAYGMS
jgi:hypothetical protein